jgi:hypothetical protein
MADDRIFEELETLNATAKEILSILKREPSRSEKLFNSIATGVTIGGIIA